MDKSDPSGLEYLRDRELGIVRREIMLPADALITAEEFKRRAAESLAKALKDLCG
jgi:hypothetical protein